MIPPKQRPIVASIASVFAVMPLLTVGITHGKTQGLKNEDESLRLERLTTVTQDSMAQKCYVNIGPIDKISKGTIIRITDAVPASSCIRDDHRYGFIGIVKGQVTVLEAFSPKEVQSEKSNLVKGKK